MGKILLTIVAIARIVFRMRCVEGLLFLEL